MKLAVVAVASVLLAVPAAGGPSVRQIPIAGEVDIVIAGGGCGAVAAAAGAAQAGATVFLITPRQYLGDDIAGAMQLWLEPGETPNTSLARAVFNDPQRSGSHGVPFTYKADKKTGEKHKDTWPASLLSRGIVGDVQRDSVQYDDELVTITADLGKPQIIREIEVAAFHRATDFAVSHVGVQLSADGKNWRDLGRFPCGNRGSLATLQIPVGAEMQHAKLAIRRMPEAKRMLLGTIRFLPPASPQTKAQAPRPFHVKQTLEEALRDAKVNFLFGCYATGLLVDKAGKPAGLVMANRSGRQAILAKVVVDATENALLAQASAPKGSQTLRFITIASGPPRAAGVQSRKLAVPVQVFNKSGFARTTEEAFWFENTLALDCGDGSWAARAALEQTLRDNTYVPSQLWAADVPVVPPPTVTSHVERLHVILNAGKRPVAAMEDGAKLGAAIAAEARALAKPEGVKVASDTRFHPGDANNVLPAGDLRESLAGLRPIPSPQCVPEAARPLPVFGRYDVVVIGGGTAGAAAGIGAARNGARTLVVENLYGLGGVGTLGMIGKYWYGNRVGFAASVPENPLEVRMEFLRSELRKAGGDVWFGSIGCGSLLEGNRVTGAVVATPYGRGLVLAKTVIDGTGNAEIAATAGAQVEFVEDFFALQASHLPPREIGSYYINGNITAVDAADPLDVRETMRQLREHAFDRGQLVDSRERQRITGDYTLDWLDQINHRTFPDSIAFGQSDYDSHGYQIHPFFMLRPARPPGDHGYSFGSHIPFRCLLPRGVEGMLVVGLGLSAHRDAMPIIRMQPDLQNSGYAAGAAAAMAAKAGITPRQVNVRKLQQHLVEIGNLPQSVLEQTDSYPFSPSEITSAVSRVTSDYDGLERLLAQPQDSLPLLRAAHDSASGANKLIYAQVLGVMGDAHGIATLIAEARRRLDAKDLARPVPITIAKPGKKTRTETPMDEVARLAWALGSCGDRRAVPLLCELSKAAIDTSGRFRAIAVSLGRLRDKTAAPALADMLRPRAGTGDTHEIIAACALFRCGDFEGMARTSLERMVTGTNGPASRLAWQVLSGVAPAQ